MIAKGGQVMPVSKPESLEGRWDILYRDYPEVYEAFAQIERQPDILAVLGERFHFAGKRIADIGSGTGASTLKLAQVAESVVGIEIDEGMNAIAVSKAQAAGVRNVQFRLGDAEHIPLEDGCVDVAIGVTLAGGEVHKVAQEMERITGPEGWAMRVDVAPGWYGGELNPVITGRPRDESPEKGSLDEILPRLGYSVLDVFLDQDYESVEQAVETYGFIHGKATIDYIRAKRVTAIRWKFRVHYKQKLHGGRG
jgi:ubiquinone/menaquinone biosynthesis C-methylase UbiE